MSDSSEDERPGLIQLMDELQRLEEERQTLDLRDPAIVEAYQQKLDALRRKIKLLNK